MKYLAFSWCFVLLLFLMLKNRLFWVTFLADGLFLGFKIWPHSHLPVTNIPEYPPGHHGRSLEIPRGRKVLKVKVLEESMKLNWNFLAGGTEIAKQQQKTMGVSINIFWNCIFLDGPTTDSKVRTTLHGMSLNS